MEKRSYYHNPIERNERGDHHDDKKKGEGTPPGGTTIAQTNINLLILKMIKQYHLPPKRSTMSIPLDLPNLEKKFLLGKESISISLMTGFKRRQLLLILLEYKKFT
eukprot:409070_1